MEEGPTFHFVSVAIISRADVNVSQVAMQRLRHYVSAVAMRRLLSGSVLDRRLHGLQQFRSGKRLGQNLIDAQPTRGISGGLQPMLESCRQRQDGSGIPSLEGTD